MNTPNQNAYLGQQQKNNQQILNHQNLLTKPYVRILEQPSNSGLRFRYRCEGRSAGSLTGYHSTNEKKTYPTIEIVNYQGKAQIIVSCVTINSPYRAHPHFLVGKDQFYIDKKKPSGIVIVDLAGTTQMKYQFESLGIQCVRKKDVIESLNLRKQLSVDPFKQGFSHDKELSFIDLNAVRLCFQVFIKNKDDQYDQLEPIVSDIIYDKKTKPDLRIEKINPKYSSILGGQEIDLLCNNVSRDITMLRIFELNFNGQIIWEIYVDLLPRDVHKQSTITFKTPKYRLDYIQSKVKCFVQLCRKTDNKRSEPKEFHYLPEDAFHKINNYLIEEDKRTNLDFNYLPANFTLNNLASLTANNFKSTNLVNNLSIQNLQPKINLPSTITSFHNLKRKRLENEDQVKRNYLNRNLVQTTTNCLNSIVNTAAKQIDNQLILNSLNTSTSSAITSIKQAQLINNNTYLNNLHQLSNLNTVNCINLPINSINSANNSLTSTLSSPLSNNSFSLANLSSSSQILDQTIDSTNYQDLRSQIYQAQFKNLELNQRSNLALSNEQINLI